MNIYQQSYRLSFLYKKSFDSFNNTWARTNVTVVVPKRKTKTFDGRADVRVYVYTCMFIMSDVVHSITMGKKCIFSREQRNRSWNEVNTKADANSQWSRGELRRRVLSDKNTDTTWSDRCNFFYWRDYLVSPLTTKQQSGTQLNGIIAKKGSTYVFLLFPAIYFFNHIYATLSRTLINLS